MILGLGDKKNWESIFVETILTWILFDLLVQHLQEVSVWSLLNIVCKNVV